MKNDCPSIRERLLDDAGSPEIAEHLAGCEGCRREAVHLERLHALLATDVELEVPAALDRAVRQMLAAPLRSGRALLRPGLAAGLGAAACLALAAALSSAFAAAGAAETGVLVGTVTVTLYLVASMVISIPILLATKTRRLAAIGEIER
jgi:anti-sigma factor RsiW